MVEYPVPLASHTATACTASSSLPLLPTLHRQEQSGCIILHYLVTKHYFSSSCATRTDICPCT
jgi:hypothetical protein